MIDYPQALGGAPFPVYGYPIATVIAEKLSTAVALGDLTTRHPDYADIYQLVTRHRLDGDELSDALAATADHRGIPLRPLSSTITDLPTRRQAPYTAWLRRQATHLGAASYVLDLTVAGRGRTTAGREGLDLRGAARPARSRRSPSRVEACRRGA